MPAWNFTFPEYQDFLLLIVGERRARRLTVGTTMICQSGSRQRPNQLVLTP